MNTVAQPDDDGLWIAGNEIQPTRVRWLWHGMLPRGKVTILEGDPGLGKSTMLTHLAARVTSGSRLPYSKVDRRPSDVIIASLEDGASDTIVPRLLAHGADTGRVHLLDPNTLLRLPSQCGSLERVVIRQRARLVIIDPLFAALDRGLDSYKDQDVRSVLTPLGKVAERSGAAIVVVRHLNKKTDGSPISRGMGSIGLTAAARSAILVARHPADPAKLIVASVKSNLGRAPRPMSFEIVPDSGHYCGRIAWLKRVDLDPSVLYGNVGRGATRHQSAVDLLSDILKRGGVLKHDVVAQMSRAGFGRPAIASAKRSLNVEVTQAPAPGKRGPGPAIWSLPE